MTPVPWLVWFLRFFRNLRDFCSQARLLARILYWIVCIREYSKPPLNLPGLSAFQLSGAFVRESPQIFFRIRMKIVYLRKIVVDY